VSITQLQQQISEREGKIAQIQQSKNRFEQELSTLRAEEHSLIVPARTGEDAAKTRLIEIRQGIEKAEREIKDDAAAISHFASEVDKLRASLATEQFEAERKRVLREVAKFTERARASRDRIAATAKELRAIGVFCESEADAVRKMLTQLNGELADKGERTVKLSSMELTRSLEQAVNLLEAPPYAAIKTDCMWRIQNVIVALERLTRDVEREAEPVPA
jgi:chromosome segregation ATPase